MMEFMLVEDPALTRHAVFVGEDAAGIIAVRNPWLRGPYLQLLALLKPFQGQGHGVPLINWFEAQAQPSSRWLWLCHSDFNTGAGAFYRRQGFEEVTTLTDLMFDGGNEVLMRKRVASTEGM
jgi:GNAT superfamily N-acetyltransferase